MSRFGILLTALHKPGIRKSITINDLVKNWQVGDKKPLRIKALKAVLKDFTESESLNGMIDLIQKELVRTNEWTVHKKGSGIEFKPANKT